MATQSSEQRESGFRGALQNVIQKATRLLSVMGEPVARRHAVRLVDAACDEVRDYTTEELK